MCHSAAMPGGNLHGDVGAGVGDTQHAAEVSRGNLRSPVRAARYAGPVRRALPARAVRASGRRALARIRLSPAIGRSRRPCRGAPPGSAVTASGGKRETGPDAATSTGPRTGSSSVCTVAFAPRASAFPLRRGRLPCDRESRRSPTSAPPRTRSVRQSSTTPGQGGRSAAPDPVIVAHAWATARPCRLRRAVVRAVPSVGKFVRRPGPSGTGQPAKGVPGSPLPASGTTSSEPDSGCGRVRPTRAVVM